MENRHDILSAGAPLYMRLLFKEQPAKEIPKELRDYIHEYPLLKIEDCICKDNSDIDEINRGQMWDCPDSEKILAECKYRIIAYDYPREDMDFADRANMLMIYLDKLLEIYQNCEAVYFENTGKLFTREQIVNSKFDDKTKFINLVVNVRYFALPNSDEMIIDTIGMNILYLPDVQYHFRKMNPNYIFAHAYNMLGYIFINRNSIRTGETVDGISGEYIDGNVQWTCRFEDSLLKPLRPVVDVDMGEFAAGKR